MTRYKLSYFDVDGGRAEPIRLALHIGGVAFEDDRLSFPQFGKMRGSTRFNSIPVMTIDGSAFTQSNALLRYVGRHVGLYPEDALQQLYCDEPMDAVEDLMHYVVPTFGLKGDDLKAAREKLLDGWLKTYVSGLGQLLERGGDYFADGRLTIADLKVFVQVRSLRKGTLDHIPSDFVDRLAPNLAAHQDRVAADERIAAYYAARSK